MRRRSRAKNRQRLLDAEVADEFFAAVVRQAKLRRYISSDHFTVDGTLLEAWASHKSFKPEDGRPADPPVGRNAESAGMVRNARMRRISQRLIPKPVWHASRPRTAAKMSYAGHLLMENRNALIVDARASPRRPVRPNATARSRCSPGCRHRNGDARSLPTRPTTPAISSPRHAVSGSLRTSPRTHRSAALRSMVAQQDAGHVVSQRIRKRVEEPSDDKPSAVAANFATSADNATGPGSRSKPPSITSSESPPSTPPPPDRHRVIGQARIIRRDRMKRDSPDDELLRPHLGEPPDQERQHLRTRHPLVRVAVMDVGQVFVLVRQWQVSVTLPRQHLDGSGPVMWIIRIDRVRVFDGGVGMTMAVVGRADDDHPGERHQECDERRRRQPVAVDRPGEECPDERRQRKDRLSTSGTHQPSTGDPHRDRQPVADGADRQRRKYRTQTWDTYQHRADEQVHRPGDDTFGQA